MAAPTSVRAEAASMTSVTLRWSYAGSNNVVAYRSTDGSSYSKVDGSSVLAAVTSFTDTGLDAGTKYYYKLSDDDGSTFSSVVSTYTHFCADQDAGQAFALPRFDDGQQDQSAKLNEMADRVEAAIGNQQIPDSCLVCPEDGAVVIDCTDGCNSFLVIADQDINSFSINRCGASDPSIAVYIPPSQTRQICGFPAGYGFTGDECNEAALSGGTDGRTMFIGGGTSGGGSGAGSSKPGLPKTKQSAGSGSGGGSGGTRCECVPGKNNQLTLKCCTANCSLTCTSTKALAIKVCGGIGPYTFSHTGSVKFKTGADGSGRSDTVTTDRKNANPSVTVVPPTNSGSAVAGNAYTKYYLFCQHGFAAPADTCTSSIFNFYAYRKYGCNDVATTSCLSDTADVTGCSVSPTSPCKAGDCNTKCSSGNCSGSVAAFRAAGGSGISEPCQQDANLNGGGACDTRSAGMISNGCNPCGVQSGAVITVTDASGASVSITLKA